MKNARRKFKLLDGVVDLQMHLRFKYYTNQETEIINKLIFYMLLLITSTKKSLIKCP